MHALFGRRAVLALGAYSVGWILAPVLAVLAVDPVPEEAASPPSIVKSVQREFVAADEQLAAWLLVDHETEIAISQLAKERAHDATVRRFAQVMVDDHTRFVQQLRPFAGTMLSQLDRARRNESVAAKAHAAVAVNATPRAATGDGPGNTPLRAQAPREPVAEASAGLLQIKRELGLQRIASTRALFEEQERTELTRCYLQHQVAAHRQMLDTLAVFKGHASVELASVLDEASSTIKTHLEHAERLLAAMSDDAPRVTAFLPATVPAD